MSEQMRLDMLLVTRGLVSGRDRAKELISQGQVLANGQKATKAAQKYDMDVPLEILNDAAHFVSRAAHKLEGALQSFGIDLTGRVVLDVGASTGGFTQCALEKGASQVFAVDVGSGQLAPQLVADSRVCNLEKTDIRLLRAEQLTAVPDFAACDVSFISLRLVLPSIAALLSQTGEAVVLIKPQFEAGRSSVGRGGIVKDAKVHLRVLQEMVHTFHANGFLIGGMTVSPITGGDGNVEVLAWLRRPGEEAVPNLEDLVKKAHLRK
jgi:23S rRNA (cytidine1920-2'-O)/16S rRNA (cytidine1409-2'-O)-methyltransferase